MKKIIKIILSIILLILFWISGYFGITKILEIKEEKLNNNLELKEGMSDSEILKMLNSGDFLPSEEEEKEMEKASKKEKIEKENKILKANIISNNSECGIYKNNSNLWINREIGFRACVPFDYKGHPAIGGYGDIDDYTDDIGLVSGLYRDDGYFSRIRIDFYKKGEKFNKDINSFLLKTKTHNVVFNFDKSNKEHTDFIKSLKLVDDLIKIKPNSVKEIKIREYIGMSRSNNLDEIINRETISFYTGGFDDINELKNKKNADLEIIDIENEAQNIIYKGTDFNKKYKLDSSFRPFMYKGKIGFTGEKNKKLYIYYDGEIISNPFDIYEESMFSLDSEIPFRILKNGLLQYVFRIEYDYYIGIINLNNLGKK